MPRATDSSLSWSLEAALCKLGSRAYFDTSYYIAHTHIVCLCVGAVYTLHSITPSIHVRVEYPMAGPVMCRVIPA